MARAGQRERALDKNQRRELLAQFTDDELSEILAARQSRRVAPGPQPGKGVGLLAAAIEGFLVPQRELSAHDQLAVMREFWALLGLRLPDLDVLRREALEATLTEHATKRVLPTPLLTLEGRRSIAERAGSNFPTARFGAEPFWTADPNWLYGKLLERPDAVIPDGSELYAMGYKLPSGQVIIGRSNWIAAMNKHGHSVAASDGTSWVFPVMDVHVYDEREARRSDRLFDEVDPAIAPETLILLQTLHQIAGASSPDWHVDFANEAVFETNEQCEPVSLVSLASVRWYASSRQIFVGSWYAVYRRDGVGLRSGINGLTGA